jgi:HD-like signal output (HDOD) protein
VNFLRKSGKNVPIKQTTVLMNAELATHYIAMTPDDIVREVQHLPSAPKVLPRLKELLTDGNSAMHEIVALIRLDPGIAARVLQVANSAYFSKGVRCFTVNEAVNRVGYDEVYELVLLAVSSQVLVRPLDVYGIDADELWRLSVSGAIAAELLALRTRQDRDVAYSIGLLHCVGMVAIDEWALRHARHLTLAHTGFPREAVDAERATFGFTQAETGAALLRHWDFPASMSEPVRWQYAPRASASQAKMACLLAAAKWLRSAVCAPKGAKAPPAPDAAHLQLLGLGAASLQAMVPEITARMTVVSSLLEDTKSVFDLRQYAFPSKDWAESKTTG